MNEEPGHENASDSASQPSHSSQASATVSKPKSNAIRTDDIKQQGESKPRVDKAAWIQAVCTIAIVFITGFYTYYARQSAGASIKAAKAAKESADAANRAATTAENTFNLNKDFGDKTLGEMKRQSAAMQGAASAAKAQTVISQKAMDASLKSSRLEQRAWVSAIVFMPKIELDKPLVGTVSVRNSGRTFAYKTIMTVYASFASHELNAWEELKKDIPMVAPASVALLAPNVTYQATVNVPVEDIPRVKQRLGINGFTYISGDISYYDVFGQPHMTQYCGYRSQASSSIEFEQCKFHTDAN
jgi:hypothetical protein